ncbi:hypothetical protein TrLO_g7907 [Triparma laevis f. longispina]|uniref:Uncharacterized protein n=1 Tax=Triparma laevis f. longispina TaxID=1714387 RepID=A0A9W7L0S5_9STRA|nr:hypothetical protein TrLO_g7907 [Triparma laevis f. longispina]
MTVPPGQDSGLEPPPPKYSLADIRTSVARNKASFQDRAATMKQTEEDNHRYARSMLMLARLDTEEQSAKAKKNRRRGGVLHNAANPPDPSGNWETSSINSQSSLNSFASSIKSASTQKTLATSVTSKKYSEEEEAERNLLFTEIQDLKKAMKRADEPNEIALKVARLYVELDLQKLSIPFFTIASHVVPYHAPRLEPEEEEKEARKLERMGREMKRRYLEEKQQQAEAMKNEHAERQRLRVMSAHHEIFLAHLEIHEAEEATHHMRQWLGYAHSETELNEMRLELDRILSKYHDLQDMGMGDWKDKDYNDAKMRMKETLGSLRDLHLETLEALLSLTPKDAEILLKLSRLHGFVRNFQRSQYLYDIYIGVTEGEHIAAMKTYKHSDFYDDKVMASPRARNEFGSDTDPWAKSTGVLGAAPSRITSYDVDTVFDRVNDSTRRDFTEFRTGDMAKRGKAGAASQVSGGRHIGSSTIIYTVPPGGWSDDDTQMRSSKGGMVSAISSGKEEVEKEIKQVSHSLNQGHKVKKSGANRKTKQMGSLRKSITNSNNSNIFKNNKESVMSCDDDKDDFLPEEIGEGLQLPLPLAKWPGKPHVVADPAWKKGGSLPPRLYDSHDFRPMPHHQLAEPDKYTKRESLSVFADENQAFDVPPLVRFRHDGSALTDREVKRMFNIEAKKGRFGGIYEKPLRPKLVQTFGGRSEKPTPDMVESFNRDFALTDKKKQKKKKGKEAELEAKQLKEESLLRRNKVMGKMKKVKEKRFTNVGGLLVPSKTGSVDWKGKLAEERSRIAVPKSTPAGYGQGKVIMGSLEEETEIDGLRAKLAKVNAGKMVLDSLVEE